MSFALNNVVIGGNLTRDCEVKFLPSGTAVCDFTIAINEKSKSGEKTHFIEATSFGRTAEVMGDYCRKGDPIAIVGRLSVDTWQSDGKNRSKTKVIAERMQMLGSKSDKPASQGSVQGQGVENRPKQDSIADDGSIPF